MPDQTPIVFLGSGPNFSGITQLKTADRLVGVVNEVDFGNDAVVSSDGAGAVAPVVLTANTLLGNTGAGIAALSVGDVITMLSVKTDLGSLDDVVVAAPADLEVLTYVTGNAQWENTALVLDSITNVSVAAAVSGQRLEYDGASWDAVTPKERVVVVSEVGSNTTAVASRLYPVDVTGSVVTITPPSNPAAADYFAVSDSRANASANAITVDFSGAGQNFHGSSINHVMSVDRSFARFRYINATIGWILEI